MQQTEYIQYPHCTHRAKNWDTIEINAPTAAICHVHHNNMREDAEAPQRQRKAVSILSHRRAMRTFICIYEEIQKKCKSNFFAKMLKIFQPIYCQNHNVTIMTVIITLFVCQKVIIIVMILITVILRLYFSQTQKKSLELMRKKKHLHAFFSGYIKYF